LPGYTCLTRFKICSLSRGFLKRTNYKTDALAIFSLMKLVLYDVVSLAIRNIGRIRRYLTQNDTERLVHAFVTSKLGTCNSLIEGLPAYEEAKLQRIQNSAARLVARVKKFDHISPVLNNLHWLTVRKRITFKILLITYKALHGLVPTYLSELLTVYTPPRCLRSEISNIICS